MTSTKQLLLIFISLIGLTTISACSTVSGMGKDIQKAGQVIEREAEKKKKSE
jgi:predicted small secreted protein